MIAMNLRFVYSLIIKGILALSMFLGSIQLQAQNQDRAEIQAFKIAFYTKRLMLTPDEAKGFWPVHDAYSREMRKAQKTSKEKLADITQGMLAASDDELSNMGDEFLELKQVEFDIVKKYHQEFKKVLPIRKVALLYVVEANYKKKLVEEIKRRRQERLRNRGRR
ncbi:MAG: hypothetical protein AAF696_18815 [Bacteroidota bacterium]